MQTRAQLPLFFSPGPRPSPWNGATYVQGTPLTQLRKILHRHTQRPTSSRQSPETPFPGDSVLYQVDKRPPQNYSNLVILLLIRSYWCSSPGCAVCAVGPLTSAALSTSFQQLPVPIGQFIPTVCIWGLMHVFWFHQWCSLVYITYCLCSEWFFKRRWEYGQIYNIVKLQVSRKSLKMVFF